MPRTLKILLAITGAHIGTLIGLGFGYLIIALGISLARLDWVTGFDVTKWNEAVKGLSVVWVLCIYCGIVGGVAGGFIGANFCNNKSQKPIRRIKCLEY